MNRTLRLQQPHPYRLLYTFVDWLPLERMLTRQQKDAWIRGIKAALELLVETAPEPVATDEFVMWGHNRFPVEDAA